MQQHQRQQQQQAGGPGGPGGPGVDSRDEKPSISAISEERLKNSASSSPHPRDSINSAGSGIIRQGQRASPLNRSPRSSTPNEESMAKRIKSEESARKSGHVSWLCFLIHSANPQSRPVVITIFTHNFSQNQLSENHCPPNCRLAKWIVIESYFVCNIFCFKGFIWKRLIWF